jgi:hypothetical protein
MALRGVAAHGRAPADLTRMRVAVLQSNYIPWKGYFDIIHDVDLFVFYDDVQYTKGDWRNRNRIKTPRGVEWLTIPAGTRNGRLICDVEIQDRAWATTHWRRLVEHYRQAPYFERYRPYFEDVYLHRTWLNLSELNQFVIRGIASDLLGIQTTFADSRDYQPMGRKLDRLLDVIQKTGGDIYVSGPAARSYIVPSRFEEMGVELVWKDYSDYPQYPQFFEPFAHDVTILDLLFHTGPNASHYVWGWRHAPAPPGS